MQVPGLVMSFGHRPADPGGGYPSGFVGTALAAERRARFLSGITLHNGKIYYGSVFSGHRGWETGW